MRVAYVSGGGTGIGAAVARGLVADGCHVVVLGRREHVLRATARRLREEFPDGRIDVVPVDLADAADVGRAVAEGDRLAGRGVDVVVNNAGGTSGLPMTTLEEAAVKWETEWRTNVLTAVLLTTAVLPRLRRPGARVVMVSSAAALRGGGAYGAAKAALHAWMYDLARHLGGGGTANVVAPGFVDDGERCLRRSPEERTRLLDETLVGRGASAEDVAGAVRWLAAPGTGHVTGQVVQVNGGAVLGRG